MYSKVILLNGFLKERQEKISKNALEHQLTALSGDKSFENPTYAIHNLEVASGEKEGEYIGQVYQDSDLAKWIEAAAYYLENNEDKQLENKVDYLIDLYDKIKTEDGYFNTYYQTHGIHLRFTNLHYNHELYCLGHMIEAAIAYFNATGKRKLLNMVCEYADLVYNTFGPEEDKLKGYPGHQEIELALIRLYETTGNNKYLELARFFVLQRGTKPEYFVQEAMQNEDKGFRDWHMETFACEEKKDKVLKHTQSHMEVYNQTEAVGHAVRAVYMYASMADIARICDDKKLLKSCNTLWDNVVNKKMYVTGGIGADSVQESFSIDFDLPNESAYNETCAAIGLFLWAQRMFNIHQNSVYTDIMERTLYNAILAGISLDGKKYFYVNPLEVWADAWDVREIHFKAKAQRQSWFACCCCPTNVLRLMTSIQKYVYSEVNGTLFVNLYASSRIEIKDEYKNVSVTQKTAFPWDGNICFSIYSDVEYELAFRIPCWCSQYTVSINKKTEQAKIKDGYIYISKKWNDDEVELSLNMDVLIVYPNSGIRENAGKIALQRGALIYCLEQTDNGEGLKNISLHTGDEIRSIYDDKLLDGAVYLEGKAKKPDMPCAGDKLYSYEDAYPLREMRFKAIPYYAWANREAGEMIVWLRRE